jgi:cytochrome c-type biogenesis protein CcmH
MKYLLLAFWLLLSLPAMAVGVDAKILADPQAEARARALMTELRCLVCQNQSISDSDATMAEDLRHIVRERIMAGDSDAEIKAYLVARYGDWILLNPPFNAATLLLWLGPFVLLCGGVIVYVRRSRRPLLEATPLSHEERAALEKLP